MKIVCISDTHTQIDKISIPDGDILVHAGDLSYRGTIQEISQELTELSKHKSKFKEIVLIAGNHDWLSERTPELMEQMCKDNGLTYLCNSGVEIEGINFWGSPVSPFFCNWAWNRYRGPQIKQYWDLIPDNTNALITHGPPMGILDTVPRWNRTKCQPDEEHVGCEDLYNRVMELKDLKLHVFGHIHSHHGSIKMGNTTFINASNCTEEYNPTNKPLIISI